MAARKLNDAARQLIRERIVAGDANNEILEQLRLAGYRNDLTKQTLSTYRADPAVLAQIVTREDESYQVGYAQRSKRIEILTRIANEYERRLFMTDVLGLQPLPLPAFSKISFELRMTLLDLARLIDPIVDARRAAMEAQGNINALPPALLELGALPPEEMKERCERARLSFLAECLPGDAASVRAGCPPGDVVAKTA